MLIRSLTKLTMKYLKDNKLSDIKKQLSDVAKAKDCSQLLTDSLKDQINSLQNEIEFLREELRVKNHLLELSVTSKEIDFSTTYPFSQQIRHHTQKISDKKRRCSININGNNNITIKPLTQKDSVEISLKNINNNDIAKNNAHEERTIATITTEINKDMCDTQNNIVVEHMKNDVRKVNGNQLYHILSKDTRQRNDSQFNARTKNASVEAMRKGLSVKKKKTTPEWRDCVCDLSQILICGCDLFNYRAIKLVTYTACMCLNRSCTQCVCEKSKRSNYHCNY